jgi:hypothetical protein
LVFFDARTPAAAPYRIGLERKMQMDIREEYLESAKAEFSRYKALGLKSIEALSEEELNRNIQDSNSIAIIVKHLHGNMKSRWTGLFTEDGEKPDRNRDGEFTETPLGKEEILKLYLQGWEYTENALSQLKAADFGKPVVIRKEPLSLVQAINRQVSHYGYHIGQIVMLAKQVKGPAWVSLSVPKGKSRELIQGDYTKK